MTKNPYIDTINDILNKQLCDFQKATVDYLYKRMIEDGQKRMLVADEVGLGKTWIAKGLIAKVFSSWCESKENVRSKKSFNVFYICSNQALTNQNLEKLNFGEDKCIAANVDRLTMFALKPQHDELPFHIYALTPDTSFKTRSTEGVKRERYIIYLLLCNYSELNADTLYDFLKGTGNYAHDESKIDENDIRKGLRTSYRKALQEETFSMAEFCDSYQFLGITKEMSIWNFLKEICKKYRRRDDTPKYLYRNMIGELKRVLIKVCMNYMDADIFIMDEFQRYSKLIEVVGLSDEEYSEKEHSESDSIARNVFRNQDARILMLSATPFKAYTNENDELEGEIHFSEFMKVLKFLYQGNEVDWDLLEKNRRRFFSSMIHLKDVQKNQRQEYIDRISAYKNYLETAYSKVMVRTEKIIASNNANGMTREKPFTPLAVTHDEIQDFVNLDKVFMSIYERKGGHAPVPIEYAKSAPYAMSFLRDYKIWERAKDSQGELAELFKSWKKAFVDLRQINNYQFNGSISGKAKKREWPNGKLNILMKDISKNSMLLWCPPSLPYYPLSGSFRGREKFSKTLIFSAWKLVPKMVSTIMSYVVEQDTIGRYDPKAHYFASKKAKPDDDADKYRRPLRQLVFNTKAKNMTTLLLAYPSVTLAELYDPLENLQNGYDKPNVKAIVKVLQNNFYEDIKTCIKDYPSENYDIKSDNTAINWILPIKKDISHGIDSQWIKEIKAAGNDSGLDNHLKRLTRLLDTEENVGLPSSISESVKKKTALNLSYLVLGSPAICAYRALKRYFKDSKQDEILPQAFRIGLSFIDLFNKPESIAVVGLSYKSKQLDYWEKVIRYCADGCLQSVLDEYVFMLWNNNTKIEKIADQICRQLSLRTGTLIVDDKDSFCQEEVGRKRMRTHYAMPFGIQAKAGSDTVHSSSVRSAFNSPFRPFILTTTSIGQEGLDFHYYCRNIIHWNLPNNPIDLEQREGRINRYRGKVIRQRVADQFWKNLHDSKNPWSELFRFASNEKYKARFVCDIVPNWHIEAGNSSAWIEREVPMYEFSQDIEKYENMKKALGNYRLAFGQPRQEELVDAIADNLTEEEKSKLLINLAPIKKLKE